MGEEVVGVAGPVRRLLQWSEWGMGRPDALVSHRWRADGPLKHIFWFLKHRAARLVYPSPADTRKLTEARRWGGMWTGQQSPGGTGTKACFTLFFSRQNPRIRGSRSKKDP